MLWLISLLPSMSCEGEVGRMGTEGFKNNMTKIDKSMRAMN
jgi:hypothetical protein